MFSLLSVLLALPVQAAPKKAAPAPVAASVPALPKAAVPNVSPAVTAKPAGPAAVGAQVAGAAKSVEAAAKGAESDPRGAGRAIQAALEGVSVAKPKVEPVPAPAAPAKAFAAAYDAASAEITRRTRKPAAPAFVEAEHDGKNWSFSFDAAGHAFVTYAQQDGKLWASYHGPFTPERSVEISKSAFAKKIETTPLQAIKAAELGTDRSVLGLSIVLMPKSRDLWYVVDHEDGRRVAVNARTGKTRAMPQGPDRKRIESAVSSAASHKGRPWSETEYSMNKATVEHYLHKDGATVAQMRLFRRLLAAVPIRGGSFNPWSGD